MKSKVLVLVTALSSLVLLTACSNLQNGLTASTSSSSVEQSQSSSSESSSQEEKVDISSYDSIISKYQTAVADNQTDASINPLVVTYANSQTSPASTVYTYRDLDGNGVDELILAFKPGKLFKEHVITDIYTISKDSGQVIRLTEGPQLGMLGERMTLAYLMDNTFSYYGSAGAMAGGGSGYRFSSDGQSLVKDDSDSGADKVDLSNWGWKDLSSASTNSSSKTSSEDKTSSTSLNADELKNGNYKSAVGTWKSSNGKTITITSDGQLNLWGYTYPIDKVSSNQYVSGIYSLTYVDSSPVGNTPIQLCPKGVSDASDAGDNSKDRILATNGVPSEESYFYRVD
ncbi:hypothetical protein GMC67_05405 [Streptococcus salivarius]|jgi:hypothetical protein|uniref:DUF6287 domain-containing protein n=1 Tax=Streptococcus TaxID=1301 RepID=UPI000DA6A297|nr:MULTISPECIES: DUF6287 domain-containing protein [Streptococcus]MBK5046504.1 hypothetical protein [Streptococcus sp. 2.1]MBK5078717.1 hypothetical protein [Streptococcus sp. 22.1]MBK5162530.1 hypothetical protein [Streptococcus sp. 3.1]MTR23873.1 hypothetical protein [Streptococcus salivarius]MTR43052.1 hypothetical protein [Streptococcus salivarius]